MLAIWKCGLRTTSNGRTSFTVAQARCRSRVNSIRTRVAPRVDPSLDQSASMRLPIAAHPATAGANSAPALIFTPYGAKTALPFLHLRRLKKCDRRGMQSNVAFHGYLYREVDNAGKRCERAKQKVLALTAGSDVEPGPDLV